MNEPDYREAARKLWMLLDDIDTLDDACRADDEAFRKHARSVQRKRFDVLSGEQFDALAAAPSTPESAEKDDAGGGKGMFCDKADLHHQTRCDKQCDGCADSQGTRGVNAPGEGQPE